MSTAYGYWIGKNDIHECRLFEHEKVAENILFSLHQIVPGSAFRAGYSVYRVMYRLGYVRVVNEYNDETSVSYGNVKHSKLQKQFIREATRTEEKDVAEIDLNRLQHLK